jgi:hypothetical protein
VRTTMWFAKCPWTIEEVPDGDGMWVGSAPAAEHLRAGTPGELAVQLGRSVERCRQALALLVSGHGPILHHNAYELGSR